jgi:hypothetical protein
MPEKCSREPTCTQVAKQSASGYIPHSLQLTFATQTRKAHVLKVAQKHSKGPTCKKTGTAYAKEPTAEYCQKGYAGAHMPKQCHMYQNEPTCQRVLSKSHMPSGTRVHSREPTCQVAKKSPYAAKLPWAIQQRHKPKGYQKMFERRKVARKAHMPESTQKPTSFLRGESKCPHPGEAHLHLWSSLRRQLSHAHGSPLHPLLGASEGGELSGIRSLRGDEHRHVGHHRGAVIRVVAAIEPATSP